MFDIFSLPSFLAETDRRVPVCNAVVIEHIFLGVLRRGLEMDAFRVAEWTWNPYGGHTGMVNLSVCIENVSRSGDNLLLLVHSMCFCLVCWTLGLSRRCCAV